MKVVRDFQGFSQKALTFLEELANNNTKAWFDEHKAIYEQEILAQVPAFVAALGECLKTISPAIEYDTRANGAGSMMRIYRDTRFSDDKTPYKTNVAFAFWEGPRKKMENPSFGFQFGTWGAGLYAGQWVFPKDLLPRYQQAVAHPTTGAALVDALAQVRAAGAYVIQGEQYAKVPRGYTVDQPRADLLRYKGLYVSSPQIDRALLLTPALIDVLFTHCQKMAPVQQWLAQVERS